MADFREYSAAFHAQNDDLMHYGVKDMRWHHHKRKPGETTLEDPRKKKTKNKD